MVDSRKAMIMAKPTAIDSGTNRPLAAPSIKNEGMNTARMHNAASRLGTIVSAVPAANGRGEGGGLAHPRVDVLDHHRPFIHQDAHGEGESAEGHQVDRLADDEEADHRAQQGQRNRQHDDDHAAPVPEEQEDHESGENGPDDRFLDHAADGIR